MSRNNTNETFRTTVRIFPVVLVLASLVPTATAFTTVSPPPIITTAARRNPSYHSTAATRISSRSSASSSSLPTMQLLFRQRPSSSSTSKLWASTLPTVDDMKLGEMRDELESYGISTRSFLEKKEFKEALAQARAEGKVPIHKNKKSSDSDTRKPPNNGAKAPPKSATTSSSPSGASSSSREERIRQEMETAKSMKVGELKKKLQELGISTKSFFEKTEFVRAYAEAVVDGVKTKNKRGGAPPREEEKYDPSYRDVVMQKFDVAQQRLLGGKVIDIKLK